MCDREVTGHRAAVLGRVDRGLVSGHWGDNLPIAAALTAWMTHDVASPVIATRMTACPSVSAPMVELAVGRGDEVRRCCPSVSQGAFTVRSKPKRLGTPEGSLVLFVGDLGESCRVAPAIAARLMRF